jgi:hypothetical protein
MLLTPDGLQFCCGATQCDSKPISVRERLNKLTIRVSVGGFSVETIVDTGGAFLILNAEIAAMLHLHPGEILERETLYIRGARVAGSLYRLELSIVPEEGHGTRIRFDVSAFVPDDDWDLPSFLGWHACLERIRFAVDPIQELFYFGATQ